MKSIKHGVKIGMVRKSVVWEQPVSQPASTFCGRRVNVISAHATKKKIKVTGSDVYNLLLKENNHAYLIITVCKSHVVIHRQYGFRTPNTQHCTKLPSCLLTLRNLYRH